MLGRCVASLRRVIASSLLPLVLLGLASCHNLNGIDDNPGGGVPSPTELEGWPESPTSIFLDWNEIAVDGEVYHLYRDGQLVAVTEQTSYTDTGLVPGTTYTYHVIAVEADGDSSAPSVSFTATTSTTGDIQPPSVPTGLNATGTSTSTIALAWNPATDNFVVLGYRLFRDGQLVATTTSTVYVDAGLTPSTQYSYAISALDGNGNESARSTAVTARTLDVTDGTPPTAPTNLVATVTGASTVALTWTDATDNVAVAGYRVFRGGTFIATTTTNSYGDAGLTASTQYIYTVVALDAAGNLSPASNPDTVTTGSSQDTQPPTAPTAVSATPTGSSSIDVTWNAASDNVAITGYRIFRDGVAIGTSTATTYSDAGLAPSTQYTYTVVALDAAGNASPQSVSAAATTLSNADSQPPSAPTGLTASATNATTIALQWNAATDNVAVSGYRVFRNGVLIGTTSSTTYSDAGLSASTQYTYTIVAIDAAGNPSPASNSASATTPSAADTQGPSAPGNVSATATSATTVSITWTAATDNVGVSGYRIFRDGVLVATTTGTTYSDAGLSASTQYVYTIVAIDVAGNASPSSAPANVTTPSDADTTAPSTPGNLAVTATTSNSVSLSWNAATDAGGIAGYRVFRNGALISTVSGTTFTDGGLTASTQYTYTVAAVDYTGNVSPQSPAVNATTDAAADTQAPTVPGGLAANATSSSTISLTWNASSDNGGVSGYRVFRDGVQVATTSSTSYIDAGLSASTQYSYTVAAIDAAGNVSSQSAPANATTPSAADTQAPTVPTGLAATPTSSSTISLTWNAATDNVSVTGYQVFRDGAQIATTSSTSYSDAGLSPSTQYTYRVTAIDAAGNASAQSGSANATTQAVVTVDATPPSTPTGLSATATGSSTIQLNWTASTDNVGVAGYKIFRGGTQIGTTGGTTYNDAGLSASTQYTYTVAAVDTAGNTSPQSASANATTQQAADVTPPTVPTSVNASATSPSRVLVSWTPSTDAGGISAYRIYRDGVLIATTVSSSYGDAGLTPGTLYAYQVEALDLAGNPSGLSAVSTVTTPSVDVVAPTAPGGLQITGTGTTFINMSWTASTDNVGVSYYQIFRNGVSVGSTTSTSYGDAGLTPSTQYTYVVKAVDGAGNGSPNSNSVNATTQSAGDTQAPTSPTGLSATPTSSSNVSLSWTASTDNVGVSAYRIFREGVLIATTAATSYGDAGLQPSTLYHYAVTAVDAAGNASSPSNPASAVTQAAADVTAPSTPTLLNATAVSSTAINLNWAASTDNTGVAGYKVYRDGVLIATTANAAYGDAGLAPSTQYTYRVSAIDAAGNESGQSTSASATTDAGADTQPPTAPSTLAATATGSSSIGLTWTASTDNVGISGYRVYRNGVVIGTTSNTSYGDAGLDPSTQYTYVVTALDASGNESAQSNSASATTQNAADTQAPTVPGNLAATSTGSTTISVSWSAATDNVGVVGYQLYRGGVLIATTSSTTYGDAGLTAATQYSYTVAAVDGAGNASAQSSAATATTDPAVVVDNTAPSVPTNLAATATSSTTIGLTWTASTDNIGVTAYRVYRGGALIATTSSTSYGDAGLTPSTLYTYTVSALDAAGNASAQSTSASATTQAPAPDIQPPTTPLNLTAVGASPTSIQLNWNASTDDRGVVGYHVFRAGVLIATVTGTSYLDATSLCSATSYSYQVDAYDAAGNVSAKSNNATGSTTNIPVNTGAMTNFAVIGSTNVTLSGVTGILVTGDIGVTPGNALGGLLSILTLTGNVHLNDAAAVAAMADAGTIFNSLSSQAVCGTGHNLTGQTITASTLTPGVYQADGNLTISGTLTLNAQGDSNAVFIFKTNGNLSTTVLSQVVLTNGAKARNVYWITTGTTFIGATVAAKGTYISNGTVASSLLANVQGRLISRQAGVTLLGTVQKP